MKTKEEIKAQWLYDCNVATDNAIARLKELENVKQLSPYAAEKYFNEQAPVFAKPGGVMMKTEELKRIIIDAFKAGYKEANL